MTTRPDRNRSGVRLVLASGSPRRRDLLDQMNLSYECVPPHLDESAFSEDTPASLVTALAEAKARAVRAVVPGAQGQWILAADTVVVVDGEILGKPADVADARHMISLLSGRSHDVVTGIAVWPPGSAAPDVRVSQTRVTFGRLTEHEMSRYLASGDWQGVAGGYRIQGLAALHIETISGSYSNVVGLPIHLVYSILMEHGYPGI